MKYETLKELIKAKIEELNEANKESTTEYANQFPASNHKARKHDELDQKIAALDDIIKKQKELLVPRQISFSE